MKANFKTPYSKQRNELVVLYSFDNACCCYAFIIIVGCSVGEFMCRDAACIPSDQRCDMVINCADGSDERDCCRSIYEFISLMYMDIITLHR